MHTTQFGRLSTFSVGFIIVFVAGCVSHKAAARTEETIEAQIASPQQICDEVMRRLSGGEQSKAESLLKQYAPIYPHHQRLVFLHAACIRSRFSVRRSFPFFMAVAGMDINSVSGQCASLIMSLDYGLQVDQKFQALEQLVKKHPQDIIVRWMLAVQCRAFDRNEKGVHHYQRILEVWDPGPSLVHQTYGNLLDGLHRFEEALVQRRITVELDPAGWSYQGLGNTLTSLKRPDEANVAYEIMIELAPNHAAYWRSWAWGLLREGRLEESIEKCERAIELNPKEYRAWSHWGCNLENMGRLEEALEKYKSALVINPKHRYSRKRAFCVLCALGRDEEAMAFEEGR